MQGYNNHRGHQADTAFSQLQAAVHADPLDFISWSALLTHVEAHAASLSTVISVFEIFLVDNFPLCWAYWIKYAEIYRKIAAGGGSANGATNAAHIHAAVLDIFERSVSSRGAPHCVDMWKGYAAYMESYCGEADPAAVRAVYLRAVLRVGGQPDATPLWRAYIAFETASHYSTPQEQWEAVSHLYRRALSEYLLELPQLQEVFLAHISTGEAAGVPAATVEEHREKGTAAYEVASQGAALRAQFEDGLVRRFFHVKPLDSAQLGVWRALLDFEEAQGPENVQRTKRAYERCLVVCAGYAEFWQRYCLWLDACTGEGGAAAAEEIAAHVTSTHLRRRPDVHLFQAELLEAHGKIQEARAVYHRILSTVSPGHLECNIRLSAFERRQGDASASSAALVSAASYSAPGSAAVAFVYMHAARIAARSGDGENSVNAAREAYRAGAAAAPSSRALWLSWLEFEAGQPPQDGDRAAKVDAVFAEAETAARESGMSDEDVRDLWEWYEEWYEDYCPSIRDVWTIRAARKRKVIAGVLSALGGATGGHKRQTAAPEDGEMLIDPGVGFHRPRKIAKTDTGHEGAHKSHHHHGDNHLSGYHHDSTRSNLSSSNGAGFQPFHPEHSSAMSSQDAMQADISEEDGEVV